MVREKVKRLELQTEATGHPVLVPAGVYWDLLLGGLWLCVCISLGCHGAGSFGHGMISYASEINNEGGNLERHSLGFSHCAYWFGLEHSQLIIPGVDLDAPAERQRSDDVCRRLRFRIGGLRGEHRCATMVQLVESLSPRCGLIKLGISFDRFLSAWR